MTKGAALIQRASAALLRVERGAMGVLMGLLAVLILLNVITRYARVPLYWVDESAVYAMVWLCFIGASAATRMRLDFSVGMLTDHFSEAGKRRFRAASTLLVFAFALGLGWMCWLWLDPLGFARAGFDAKALAAQTFNFVYTERTQTLNWPTWTMYLVMPLFAATLLVHALANLVEDLGLVEPVRAAGDGLAAPDAVV